MIIDGHCDTLSVGFDNKKQISDSELQFSIKKVTEPTIQMMAAFISPEKYVQTGTQKAWNRTKDIINYFYEQKELFKSDIIQILNEKDIEKVEKLNKIGVILTIENGSSICGDLSRIKELYDMGIRVMSITWNMDNDLGCGAQTTDDTGLTELGKQYIKELIKNNIIIDISHASKKTFWDVAELCNGTNAKVVATHSCVNALCEHKRNLDDNQIKQIAKMNGIIGVSYYTEFLKNNGKATINDIINNISYISNLVGIEYVALGSDFDGIDKQNLPLDFNGVEDVYKIKEKMKSKGFSASNIQKVMADNWRRVLTSK